MALLTPDFINATRKNNADLGPGEPGSYFQHAFVWHENSKNSNEFQIVSDG